MKYLFQEFNLFGAIALIGLALKCAAKRSKHIPVQNRFFGIKNLEWLQSAANAVQ
jgi:hypothetical protein